MMKNSMRRTIIKGALALAVAGSSLLPAAAQNLTERGKGEGLRVAYYNFAPFAYVDGSGNVIGEQVEILRHVLGQMGLKVASETSTEWGNLIPGLKAKRFDIVAAAMFVTPKRCKEVAFSEPTFGIKQALIVKKDNPNTLSAYESVRDRGVTLAAISGTAQVDWAKSVGVKSEKIMQVPDTATGLAAVGAGRADAFAIDAPGARLAVKEKGDNFEMLEPFGTVNNKPASPHGAYATRPDEAAFLVEFNKHLTKFIGTDAHIAIMEKHGLEASELPSRSRAELCKG